MRDVLLALELITRREWNDSTTVCHGGSFMSGKHLKRGGDLTDVISWYKSVSEADLAANAERYQFKLGPETAASMIKFKEMPEQH